MSSSSNDFQLEMSMSLNSSTEEVTITLDSIYTGPLTSFEVYVYAAVTEKVGADSYDNGVRPNHNWRGWLLDSADSDSSSFRYPRAYGSLTVGLHH